LVILSIAIDAINHPPRTFHGLQITGNPEVGDHMAVNRPTHSFTAYCRQKCMVHQIGTSKRLCFIKTGTARVVGQCVTGGWSARPALNAMVKCLFSANLSAQSTWSKTYTLRTRVSYSPDCCSVSSDIYRALCSGERPTKILTNTLASSSSRSCLCCGVSSCACDPAST